VAAEPCVAARSARITPARITPACALREIWQACCSTLHARGAVHPRRCPPRHHETLAQPLLPPSPMAPSSASAAIAAATAGSKRLPPLLLRTTGCCCCCAPTLQRVRVNSGQPERIQFAPVCAVACLPWRQPRARELRCQLKSRLARAACARATSGRHAGCATVRLAADAPPSLQSR